MNAKQYTIWLKTECEKLWNEEHGKKKGLWDEQDEEVKKDYYNLMYVKKHFLMHKSCVDCEYLVRVGNYTDKYQCRCPGTLHYKKYISSKNCDNVMCEYYKQKDFDAIFSDEMDAFWKQ